MTQKNEYTTKFRKVMKDAIKSRLNTAKEAQARFEAHGDMEDAKLVSASKTHAKMAEVLFKLPDDAIGWCESNNLDPVKVEAGSREFKKRLAIVAFAKGLRQAVADKPLRAVIELIEAKKPATLDYAKIMRVTGHKTATQANYIKTFFMELGGVSSVRGQGIETTMTFDYDNPAMASIAEKGKEAVAA
tara:strand:+ start:286 stop:849 length:564 start_codon:yes stop_codon:yes gene_type:complete